MSDFDPAGRLQLLTLDTRNLTPVEDPVCAKRQRGTLLVKLITHFTPLSELQALRAGSRGEPKRGAMDPDLSLRPNQPIYRKNAYEQP